MNIALSQSLLNLSNEEYHKTDAEGSTDLKYFLRSPAHYNAYKNGLLPKLESDSMTLGSLFHCLVLEPETFSNRYAISRKIDGRTTAGKAEKAAFALENEGKIIVDEATFGTAKLMAESVVCHPEASLLLKNGVSEQSHFYVDPETGLQCKYRPDYRHDQYIVDLKSTRDASFGAFRNQLTNLKYHVSAAHYCMGEGVLFDKNHRQFIFVCTENVAPFLTAVYLLDDESLKLGERLRENALIGIKNCREKNNWPGYNNNLAAEIGVSKWALNTEVEYYE